MRTVKAEEAARLAEESSEEGVLPVRGAVLDSAETFEPISVSLVGATVASSVEASSEIEVSFAFVCGCIGDSLAISVGGAEVGAGEQDWLGKTLSTGVIGCSLT